MARPTDAAGAPCSEWTFLVYIGSVNNGLQITTKDVLGCLAGVNLSPRVSFVFELTQAARVVRGRVRKARGKLVLEVLERAPRVNSASPDTVTAFVDWATSTFPSRYTALVIKDHGGGLDSPPGWGKYTATRLKTLRDGVPLEIVIDGVTHEYLSNAGVRSAIERSRLGRVDVLAFDACEMNLVEIVHELRGVAGFLVATSSPLQENPSFFPYDKALEKLSASRTVGPRALARCLATANERAQLVATELSWMPKVESAMDKLGAQLLSEMEASSKTTDAIRRARASLGQGVVLDMRFVFGELGKLGATEISEKARDLLKRAEKALALACFAAGPEPNSVDGRLAGIACFFPLPAGTQLWAAYGNLAFAEKSRWVSFLVKATWPNLVASAGANPAPPKPPGSGPSAGNGTPPRRGGPGDTSLIVETVTIEAKSRSGGLPAAPAK